MKHTNIARLFNLVNKWLTNLPHCGGNKDYYRISQSIILLANTVHSEETDETIWSMGECGEFTLADLIVGAYWHYSEWHGGQSSIGYEALCALGAIYNPGWSSLDTDSGEYFAYCLLNELAEQYHLHKV